MDVDNARFLWEFIDYWAEVDPTFPSMTSDSIITTYGELRDQSMNLAGRLLDLDVQKGDVVATMLPCSPEYIASLVATDRIGGILCPLDMKYKKADLVRFISHLLPSVIIAAKTKGMTESLVSVITELRLEGKTHMLWTGEDGEFHEVLTVPPRDSEALEKRQKDQDADDGFLIVFTGGTTGVPKAALLTKQNVARMAKVEGDFLARYIPGRFKSIACLPPSHVGGTVELICAPLTMGNHLLVHDTWSPQRVLETTQRERVPLFAGVPTMYAITLMNPDLDTFDLSSLRLAALSGEKVELDLLKMIRERICTRIVNGYGSTEAGSEIAFTEPGDPLEVLAEGYVGRPLPGVELRIVNAQGRDAVPGEQGEVLVRGPYTIKRYFRMPEEDSEGFTADGYCRTGDIGYLTKEGALYIKGRIKHIIRVGSYTVLPSEVEDVALKTGMVGMAAAIGVPDSVYGEVVWLVASPMPGVEADADVLIEKCREQLASFKVPKRVVFRNEIPVTRIGKVHRVLVQQQVIDDLRAGTLQ
ncbi:MAG: acyl--CoA ligase [Spirochaetes bacterium]|nr:acyl--CoA ligase [Spirochaetota bacterium]